MILDTSFIIDLMEADRDAVKKLRWLEAEEIPVKLVAVTAFELFYGAERYVEPQEEKRQIEEAIGQIPVQKLPLSWNAGGRGGELKAGLEQDGESTGTVDTLISATALEEEEPVLTANPSHFDRVSGLEVETY
ncbi:MAG: PIN domain-containing protein [Candidatus Nanohaloarchaea archaeon]|nr:PIN domain-containing protein [Candidatus Nanohaloarchaea archaeon]